MKSRHDGTLILGIETSCDETAAAVVKDGRTVLSNVVFSQIDIHKRFGGVVPEIASRSHIEKITAVTRQALDEAGLTGDDLDAVAVTNAPGLVGALLVGVSFAKAYAYGIGKPLIAVNHIEAHICANYIDGGGCEPPFVCLVVSGGHTNLILVEDYGVYKILGKTRDDAAGEAFDKVARALGLGYPGGIEIEKAALDGSDTAIVFPRAELEEGSLDFSFSGLKSAVLNYLNKCKMNNVTVNKADVAASFQRAVVDVLVKKTVQACRVYNCSAVALAGGVACNMLLREEMVKVTTANSLTLCVPKHTYCGDNAAMVAVCAYHPYLNKNYAQLSLNAQPSVGLPFR
jgi:N6-L-threonylcarbamoyladenine synthase